MHKRMSVMLGRLFTLSAEDFKREDGQTTVEYAIIVALVVGMAVIAFGVLSTSIQGFMTSVGAKITAALP